MDGRLRRSAEWEHRIEPHMQQVSKGTNGRKGRQAAALAGTRKASA